MQMRECKVVLMPINFAIFANKFKEHSEYKNLRRSKRKIKSISESNDANDKKRGLSVRLENVPYNSLRSQKEEKSRVQSHNKNNFKTNSVKKSSSGIHGLNENNTVVLNIAMEKKISTNNSLVTKSTNKGLDKKSSSKTQDLNRKNKGNTIALNVAKKKRLFKHNSLITKSTKSDNFCSQKAKKANDVQPVNKNGRKKCRLKSSKKTQKLNRRSKFHTVHSSIKIAEKEPLGDPLTSKSFKQHNIKSFSAKKHSRRQTVPFAMHQKSSVNNLSLNYENIPIDTISITKNTQIFKTPVRSSGSRKAISKMCQNYNKQNVGVCKINKALAGKTVKTKKDLSSKRQKDSIGRKSLKRKRISTFELEEEEEDDDYEDDMFASKYLDEMTTSTPQVVNHDSDMSSLSSFPTPQLNLILTPLKPKKSPVFKDLISPNSYRIARKFALELMKVREQWYKENSPKASKTSGSLKKNSTKKKRQEDNAFLEALSHAEERKKQQNFLDTSDELENSYFSIAGDKSYTN